VSIDAPPPPSPPSLDAVIQQAGAIVARRQGRPVVIDYGSAAGELAACVSAVGLASCSELTKLVVQAPSIGAREHLYRVAGGVMAPGGARFESGIWWGATGEDEAIALAEPGLGETLRDRLQAAPAREAGVRVQDRSTEWAAIAVVGRRVDEVLADLGVYGDAGDPRRVSPVTAHGVARVGVLWLLQSSHRAVALMPQAGGAAVWRAIEGAGRRSGICAVGKDALSRYALLHPTPESLPL
jgi:glycine cleavage system aminomethyltransferase T